MLEQRALPFDYMTFVAVTNVVRSTREVAAFSNIPVPENYIRKVSEKVLESLGVEPNAQAIEYVQAYHQNTQYTYRRRNDLDYQIEKLLGSVDYFPENYHDYVKEVGRDYIGISSYHGDLLAFWRHYASHVNGRNALFSYASLFGASQNVQVSSASNYDCLYHRGMSADTVHPMVMAIVNLYDSIEELLGFSPAHTPPNIKLKLGDDDFVVTTNENSEISTISLTTLVGRIWLKGAPNSLDLGGVKIKPV